MKTDHYYCAPDYPLVGELPNVPVMPLRPRRRLTRFGLVTVCAAAVFGGVVAGTAAWKLYDWWLS